MRHSHIPVILVVVLACGIAHAKKGLYFGLGIGGAMVSGENAIKLRNPERDPDFDLTDLGPGEYASCTPNCPKTDTRKLVSTEHGGGLAFDLRFGYNILGFIALEFNASAGGNNFGDSNKLEGHGGLFGLVRIFPAQLFQEVDDRWWDPYLTVGGGGYFMAYQPDAHPPEEMNTDGRGWYPSGALKYGFGCDFYVSPFLSFGIDFSFIHGYHSTYIIDNDKDLTSDTVDTATSFAFHPSAKMTFHFMAQ